MADCSSVRVIFTRGELVCPLSELRVTRRELCLFGELNNSIPILPVSSHVSKLVSTSSGANLFDI